MIPSQSAYSKLPPLDTNADIFSLDDEDDDSTPTHTTGTGPPAPAGTSAADGLVPYSDEGEPSRRGDGIELRSVSPSYNAGMPLRSTIHSRELGQYELISSRKGRRRTG